MIYTYERWVKSIFWMLQFVILIIRTTSLTMHHTVGIQPTQPDVSYSLPIAS